MKNIVKIFRFTGSFWRWYAAMSFFIIVGSLLNFVTPFVLRSIVDSITNRETISSVFWALGVLLAADVVGSVVAAYSMWIGDLLAVRLQTFLSSKFYRHVLSLDVAYFDNIQVGNLTNKLYRGIASITNFIQNATNNFLPFFLTAIITIAILMVYSPVVGILLAALFPLYTIITHRSSVAWGKHEGKKNEISDVSQGRVLESLTGIRVVKAFVSELWEFRSFSRARESIESVTRAQSREWHVYDFLRRILLNVILFMIVSYILYQTYHGVYTLGEMTLLLQLVNQARFPLFAMSFIIGQIQQADAGSKDFFEVLETEQRIQDVPGAKALVWPKGKTGTVLSFENVSFAYDKGDVLKGIRFSLPFGEKLALVGESGQGKSTLVNLILRYYAPRKGTIFVGGKDIRVVTRASLRNKLAVVFQDALLFSGTIAENIRYGNPEASIVDMKHAAKLANASEFIDMLSLGYDTVIGERGVKLSGGQKQRIAIARAILRDAPIIILDEATSSLDSRSELLVQQGLMHLTRGKTTIIIAHRLSTLSGVDKILVLQGGRIAQFGTPSELLKEKRGLYSRMIELQKTLLGATDEERMAALHKYDLVG
ncbi:MAG TPA: ABC transporter ATP-binding protein [Patescibacteria group bacterium]|nr:ABC transporter ATP-binding protein [Patescibacteria group bacterium]